MKRVRREEASGIRRSVSIKRRFNNNRGDKVCRYAWQEESDITEYDGSDCVETMVTPWLEATQGMVRCACGDRHQELVV